jgi:hypothetical protein
MNQLRNIERWIEQLIEEPFVRLFAGHLLPQDVARHLLRALEDGERFGADGRVEVPGHYRVSLNPDDLATLQQHHPDLEERLTEALAQIVERIQIRPHSPPKVTLEGDDTLPPRCVNITPADRSAPAPHHTQELRLTETPASVADPPTGTHRDIYLIIQGERTFDLTEPVIRLGRALDNDLIIEDRMVSRYHARLRRRYGRYILEDLGSSGGTTVNGFAIQEIVLRPGDLISFSGVDLIYVESEPLIPQDRGHTQTIRPVD